MDSWLTSNVRVLQFNIEDQYGYFSREVTADYLVSLSEKVRANVIVVFARDGWGRVFYKGSKIYPLHGRTSLFVDELVKKARKKGIRVIVMTNHTANRYIYRKHPSWAQRTRKGEVVVLEHYPAEERIKDPHWPQICINSPAFTEFFLPEIEEALKKTDADAVLLDSYRYLPDYAKACYCKYCRTKFYNEHGLELPEKDDEEDETNRIAWEWRYNVVKDTIMKLWKKAKNTKSNVMFMYNSHPGGWAGRGNRVLELIRDIVDGVFAEATETDFKGPGFLTFITKLNRGILNNEKPVFVSRNMFFGIRTTQSVPPEHLRMGIWEVLAAGGKPWVTVFSSQPFTDDSPFEELAKIYEEIDRMGEYLVHKKPFRHVGIVYSNKTHDWYLHRNPEYYVGETIGFSLMMMHSHIPWEIISDTIIEKGEELNSFDAIVLANTGLLSEKAEENIREYVRAGGTVIATHQVGKIREDLTYREQLALNDVFGVDYEGLLKWGYIYVDLASGKNKNMWRGLPTYILLGDASSRFRRERAEPMLGEPVRTKLVKGTPLAYFRMPRSAFGFEYTLGRSPPVRDSLLNMPSINYNKYGKGRSLYYAFRLGLHYDRLGHPHYRELFVRPLWKYVGKKIETNAPDTVQIELYRGNNELIIHLVNHTFNQRILDAPSTASRQMIHGFDPYYSVHPIRHIIPVRKIWITLSGLKDTENVIVRDVREDKESTLRVKNGKIKINVDELYDYKLIAILPKD